MKEMNLKKKEELLLLTEKLTEVQDDKKEDLRNEEKAVIKSCKTISEGLAKIESEIGHLEEPLDKILTCVGRMQNQLRSDGKMSEINIANLSNVLNEVSLKATSLYDQLYLSQNELQDSMIIDDNNFKINEKDVELDFTEKEE